MHYNKYMMQKFLVSIILFVIFIATSWSLFRSELFYVHDFIHAARVAEMARGIQDCQIPVRWSANFGYGYGMPLFEFYAPLPYFIGALFWLAHVPIEIVVKILFIFPSSITIFASYKLGRQWLTPLGGCIVAAAIALAPYRAVNLFVRGAIAESWGMAFFILSLWAIVLVVEKKRHGVLWLLSGLTGILLSHNLTALISIPALGIWTVLIVVLSAVKHKATRQTYLSSFWIICRQSLPNLSIVAMLTLGLSAFYWLPALAEKQLTQMDATILTGYFDFRLHFLYIRQLITPFWGYGGSGWGPDDGMSFFLGFGQLIGGLVTILTAIFVTIRVFVNKTANTLSANFLLLFLFSQLILLYAIFFSLFHSQFIWEIASPLLGTIQFPWRFLALASAMLGFSSSLWLMYWPKKIGYVTGVLLLLMLLTNARYFMPNEYLDNSDDLYYTESEKIATNMSETLPDFIPKGMVLTTPPSSIIRCVPDYNCIEISTVTNRSNGGSARVETMDTTTIVLSAAAYPGWSVTVDGNTSSTATTDEGLISFSLPKGVHAIVWHLGGSQIRLIADSITISSLLIFAFLIILSYKKRI
jgi:hypothetical protein